MGVRREGEMCGCEKGEGEMCGCEGVGVGEMCGCEKGEGRCVGVRRERGRCGVRKERGTCVGVRKERGRCVGVRKERGRCVGVRREMLASSSRYLSLKGIFNNNKKTTFFHLAEIPSATFQALANLIDLVHKLDLPGDKHGRNDILCSYIQYVFSAPVGQLPLNAFENRTSTMSRSRPGSIIDEDAMRRSGSLRLSGSHLRQTSVPSMW